MGCPEEAAHKEDSLERTCPVHDGFTMGLRWACDSSPSYVSANRFHRGRLPTPECSVLARRTAVRRPSDAAYGKLADGPAVPSSLSAVSQGPERLQRECECIIDGSNFPRGKMSDLPRPEQSTFLMTVMEAMDLADIGKVEAGYHELQSCLARAEELAEKPDAPGWKWELVRRYQEAVARYGAIYRVGRRLN